MENLLYTLRKVVKSPYFIISVIFVVNFVVSMLYISPHFVVGDDAVSYEETVHFLKGGDIRFTEFTNQNRLLTTPLLISSVFVLDYIVDNPYYGIILVNLVFYLLVVFIFYKLAQLVFDDKKIAIFSSIFFISNYYFININNLFLADLGGHFFMLLTNFLALKFFLSKKDDYFYLAILSSSIGVLFKEFGALGMITLGCLILLSQETLNRKLKLIFRAALLFLIIPLCYHLWFYFKYHYSYFDWYSVNVTFYPEEKHQYGPALFVKVMGWLYLIGWPMFLWGLLQAKKYLSIDKIKILLGLLPASLFFFVWPMFMQRTSFVLVPWLALVTGFGLYKIENVYIRWVLMILYIVVNYNIERLLPIVNLPF